MKIKRTLFVIALFLGKFCFAEVSISQADSIFTKSLCLDSASRRTYSIAERQAFLTQSEQNYDHLRLKGANAEIRKEAQKKWERVRIYIQRDALVGLSFWNVGTACPVRLEFPNVDVIPNSAGRKEAFSRALRYSSIGLCDGEQGNFSINERIEFLQTAKRIYDEIEKSNEDLGIQKSAQLKSAVLQTTLSQIKTKGFDYWDVGTNCPAANYLRAHSSGPVLPADGPFPPAAPRRGRAAQ